MSMEISPDAERIIAEHPGLREKLWLLKGEMATALNSRPLIADARVFRLGCSDDSDDPRLRLEVASDRSIMSAESVMTTVIYPARDRIMADAPVYVSVDFL